MESPTIGRCGINDPEIGLHPVDWSQHQSPEGIDNDGVLIQKPFARSGIHRHGWKDRSRFNWNF
jgi:hypothetical protein